MPIYNSPHMPDSPFLPIHTNMIAPGVLGVKIFLWLDSMTTGNIFWRKTNPERDRTSPKRVIVDAFEIEYCDGFGIGCFGDRRVPDP